MALLSLGLVLPGKALAQFGHAQDSGYRVGQGGLVEAIPGHTQSGQGGHQDLIGAPPPTLTNDGSPNAFYGDDLCDPYGGFFASLGAMALKRQNLGNGLIAGRDPGVNIPGSPQFFDTGIAPATFPPGLAPEILNTSDVDPNYMWGPRFTIGYQEADSIVEVTGFYLIQTSSSVEIRDMSRIDLPFAVFPIPIGFEGNNNLFLQADIARMSIETAMGNIETNYRVATGAGWEWICGIRYLDLSERFSIYVDDDSLSTAGLAPVDLTTIATYTIRSHSRILGPNMGFEGEWPVAHWLAIGFNGKGTWGVNFSEVDILLQRGDGFVNPEGPDTHRSNNQFSHMYEIGGFLDFLISERVRFRGGYQALWVVNVPEAHAQMDFNLANTAGAVSTDGSILFHGPILEFHLGL
jgi:hypothetical protein